MINKITITMTPWIESTIGDRYHSIEIEAEARSNGYVASSKTILTPERFATDSIFDIIWKDMGQRLKRELRKGNTNESNG